MNQMNESQNPNHIQKVKSSCNISTVTDGRGGIFTFIPDEPIVEFNMLYISANKVRGHHFHSEFDEYFLLVKGEGIIVSLDNNPIFMSVGMCIKNPKGVAHTFHAITDCIAVAMLTKKWDDCKNPITTVKS